jgi:hypothetical protein
MNQLWSWIVWGVVLLLQNASFTWVSRARNSGNVGYHAVASVGSNGIWFLSQIVVVSKITDAIRSHSWGLLAFTGIFYTIFTVIGSVSMHKFLMTKVEKGSRKVGA